MTKTTTQETYTDKDIHVRYTIIDYGKSKFSFNWVCPNCGYHQPGGGPSPSYQAATVLAEHSIRRHFNNGECSE